MKPDWKHLGVDLKIKKKYNEKAMSMRLIHNDILWCAWRWLQCSLRVEDLLITFSVYKW